MNTMADPHRVYEIRCPVHGFIPINDWERAIIAQPAFQRLRRIRQLAWTDLVYPGAMHTRFEHSLGVMHVVTRLYEAIVQRSAELLKSELGYTQEGLDRHKTLVRLTALLHDLGHGPFSHAAEELLPVRDDGTARFQHEDYSAAVIRHQLRDVIETHQLNRNYGFRVEDITALLEGSSHAQHALFWRELITGQMDADRMDYLLRDSLHAGVDYGRFDWRRLLHTVEAVPGSDGEGPRLGVSEGGWHAAEAMVLARYFMFTQVYFHKTRVAYDHHLRKALAELLPGGHFSQPDAAGLAEYLKWDDWRVLGLLADGNGGEHGRRLAERDHFREVFHTPETPTSEDFAELDRVRQALGALIRAEESAEKSWYKLGPADIPVLSRSAGARVKPLSAYSSVVAGLRPIRKVMLYASPHDRAKVDEKLTELRQKAGSKS
jgi:HD superfamily phosphohydrolase